jgi:hypothetical protein
MSPEIFRLELNTPPHIKCWEIRNIPGHHRQRHLEDLSLRMLTQTKF